MKKKRLVVLTGAGYTPDTTGIAVNTVAEGGLKGVFIFGYVLFFIIKIADNAVYKRVCRAAVKIMDCKTCRFIYKQNIIVLINNVDLVWSQKEVKAGWVAFKKLIIYVEGQSFAV